MKIVRSYSQFLVSLDDNLRRGVIADTNVLIAATYDLDPAHEEAAELFDLLAEARVPVFCNVNVRSEFLEIHRRIIFTEALLDFEAQVDKAKLPEDLRRRLNSIKLFKKTPNWEEATHLMEAHGLSSSDAMIINIFLCSTLGAIITSDLDVAYSLQKIGDVSKTAFLPDRLAKTFNEK